MTDTDTNAISYEIINSVLGSLNQGNSWFGAIAGVQCGCNSLFDLENFDLDHAFL